MGSLVFLRRSDEYRYAAAAVLRRARALPGAERTKARELARGLIELARSEAWLEGQRPHLRRMRSESVKRSAQ